MNPDEAMARMTAVVAQITEKYEMFTGGDSIAVLENLIENPYSVTPNEDVGRLARTMIETIGAATQFGADLAINSLRATPNTFGIYPPVRKGQQF